MQTITMASFKGGTGKTTVALHIASALALFHDKRCLLIDSDPQANLTQALGFSPDSLKALPKALKREIPIYEVIQKTNVENLKIVCSNTFLDGIEATTELLGDPYSHERLSTGLSKIKKDFDYCIIDIPPSLNWLCRSAFYAADFSLIAAVPEPFSMLAMQRLSEYQQSVNERHKIDVLGIVLSMWNERSVMNDGSVIGIEGAFPEKILKTKVRRDNSVAKAVFDGLPVFLTDKNSRASEDFKSITQEILNILEREPVNA